MNNYVATFHTHSSALITSKSLKSRGFSARMAPVPRKISSSCGTCVLYSADAPLTELMDVDVEAVYSVIDGKFIMIYQNM